MKEIQKCDEIYISEDYDMFSLIEANRVIRQSHVAKLMQSMKNKNLLNPIIVNENHQIIDGQHRYTAWKNLGMPIKYIIGEGYGFSEVTTLNENQRNWSLFDFFNHYVQLEYKEYIKLKKYMDTYDLPLTIALIFNGSVSWKGRHRDNESSTPLKQGNMQLTKYDDALIVAEKYSEIRDLFEFSSSRGFASAFKIVVLRKDVEYKRFKESLEKYGHRINRNAKVTDYLKDFQKIYNYNRKNKVRLYDDL